MRCDDFIGDNRAHYEYRRENVRAAGRLRDNIPKTHSIHSGRRTILHAYSPPPRFCERRAILTSKSAGILSIIC